MNILFVYLYRDAANYKNWGEVVFSNPNDIDADIVSSMLTEALIDGAYFVAEKAGVPDLHFKDYDNEFDHGWHEFHGCELVETDATDPSDRRIEEFTEVLRRACWLP